VTSNGAAASFGTPRDRATQKMGGIGVSTILVMLIVRLLRSKAFIASPMAKPSQNPGPSELAE
jgi:hypothetical protein